jgi:hypothetical protein
MNDLVVLVADKDMQFALRGAFDPPVSEFVTSRAG